ncbi:MAG: metallophosphoesterase [Acidobacteriota bacterium]
MVLSPNLGCPRLLAQAHLEQGKPLALLIASDEWPDGCPQAKLFEDGFTLRAVGSKAPGGVLKLRPAGAPKELTDWDCLGEFTDAEDTQWRLSRELHYGVLGAHTRYWRLELLLEAPAELPKLTAGRRLMLFDLIWSAPGGAVARINHHSVQVMARENGPLRFLHVTDLHLARRNDEILAEVLKEKCGRPADEIKASYINFNDHFRRLIRRANELADGGELDFLVITGDLVDFAFHGWRDRPCPAQNNWKVFVNMLTGQENRPGSEPLKVAVFTSLGNHDWRLHPYNPNTTESTRSSFGLRKDELAHFRYKGFKSSELRKEDPRHRKADRLEAEMFGRMNTKGPQEWLGLFLVRASPGAMSALASRVGAALLILGPLIEASAAASVRKDLPALTGLFVASLAFYLRKLVRKGLDFLIDNPLHADATALGDYFKHVNPYFDYAFRWGPHWFILMDTGADVFTGQLLDGKETRDLRKLTLEDNILGGSPDSRAFEADRRYCDWTQIVWLEKVLASSANTAGRRIVFLHAPPINTVKSNEYVATRLAERSRKEPKWIPMEECNLTFGTINHYLSQFFYLCLGCRESELANCPRDGTGKIDLVLCGHAHRNIEFRLGLGDGNQIRMYTDDYGRMLQAAQAQAARQGETAEDAVQNWWEQHRPVIAQTAACGPKGAEDPQPPYYRSVTIGVSGQIVEFVVKNLG